jgi:hypothetical protein
MPSQSCAPSSTPVRFLFITPFPLRKRTNICCIPLFRMLCLAIAAAAALAPLAAASELPQENVTITPSVGNATSSAWAEAGSNLQIALASADAQLLPLAGDLLPYNTQLHFTLPWFDALPRAAHDFPSLRSCRRTPRFSSLVRIFITS